MPLLFLSAVLLAPAADPAALLVVSINPEGRVKVARGDAVTPTLRVGSPTDVVLRVENHAGSTPVLAVKSAYAGADVNPFALSVPGGALTGKAVEFRTLRVSCKQAGRHEITVSFDAGQGTQDLGFRGEVPVLLTVTK